MAARGASAGGSGWAVAALAIGYAAAVGVAIVRERRFAERSLHVSNGFDTEDAVARYLERQGWRVTQSPGSRGPSDMDAERGAERIAIQSKASLFGKAAFPGRDEMAGLRAYGEENKRKPVVALTSGASTRFLDGDTREPFDPSRRKRGR